MSPLSAQFERWSSSSRSNETRFSKRMATTVRTNSRNKARDDFNLIDDKPLHVSIRFFI